MVKFLIHKPISVIMVFVALLILGVLALEMVPVSPLPNIDIPEITIHISKSNTSARELESTVVNKLRTQILQIHNIDNIHSETRDSYAILHVRFNYGTDINYAFIETNEKVDLSMNAFPKDMERPRVIKASVTDFPVFYINVSLKKSQQASDFSARFLDLSGFVEQVIKRRFEQLPEIAFVDITGMSYPEIAIIPRRELMNSMSLKDEDFKRILSANQFLYGNVSAMDGVLQYNIRFTSHNPTTIEEIRNISFKYHERILKLRDIADIRMTQKVSKGAYIASNINAINMAVIKQPNAKLESLRKQMDQLLVDLRHKYPNINFEQTQDQTELLDYSISSLKQDLFIGAGLAFLMMFLFLKNYRAPFLIAITVPVCLILSILVFNLFHLTINIISLSGLVLGVGLMIDNSIIVIDNINQYREAGMDLSEACVKGTTEIIRPLLTSSMTTCSVFIPLIFLSGISGALFYDQAMAITIGLSTSFVISTTLLPTLYRLFHKGMVQDKKNQFFEKYEITLFERIYEYGFHWVFHHKILSLFIVAFLVASNIVIFKHLKKERLPQFEQIELVTAIDWNRNITINENRNRTIALIKNIEANLDQSNALIGEQQYLLRKEKELSSSEVEIYIKAKNSRLLINSMNKIKNYLQQHYPEASFKLNPPKNIFEKVFADDEPPLSIQLMQVDNDRLPSKNRADQTIILINTMFPSAEISPLALQHTLLLSAEQDKLLLYDLTMDAIYTQLKSQLNTNEINSIQNGQQQIPIALSYKLNDLNVLLKNITVVNTKGIRIPCSSFLKLTREENLKSIEGGKSGNYIPLSVNTDEPQKVIDFINLKVKNEHNSDVSFSGNYISNKGLLKEMLIVLSVAICLLYFILAAQFESLVQPLIVLAELPISLSGALIMLYLFNSSINLISLIGMVVMCGIIINDSILKIDTVNNLRRNENYALIDALHTGGRRRLKSIVMTALTTILSVAPFMFGNDMGSMLQRPLSLALIGGMLIGTPVSLFFIPLVYWFYYRNEKDI